MYAFQIYACLSSIPSFVPVSLLDHIPLKRAACLLRLVQKKVNLMCTLLT